MTTYYATLLRPGALWDPHKMGRTGSLVIMKAGDAAQVREMFRSEGDVKEWIIFLDARGRRSS